MTPADGPVLGDRSRWHVDVDVPVLVEVRLQTQPGRHRPDPGQGSLRRLLHNVSDLARNSQVTAAAGKAGLDEQDLTSNRRPGKANRNARAFDAVFEFFGNLKLAGPQQVRNDFLGHLGLRWLTFEDSSGVLPANVSDLTLEVPDARFTRVVSGDVLEGIFIEEDLVRLDAIVFPLAGHQIVLLRSALSLPRCSRAARLFPSDPSKRTEPCPERSPW